MAESWGPVPLARLEILSHCEALPREDRALYHFAYLIGIGTASSYSLRTLTTRWGFTGIGSVRRIIDVVTDPRNGWCTSKGATHDYAQQVRVHFGISPASHEDRTSISPASQSDLSTSHGRISLDPAVPPSDALEHLTKIAPASQADHSPCAHASRAPAPVSSFPSDRDRIGSEQQHEHEQGEEQEQPPTPYQGDPAIAGVDVPAGELFIDDVNARADAQHRANQERAAGPPPIVVDSTAAIPSTKTESASSVTEATPLLNSGGGKKSPGPLPEAMAGRADAAMWKVLWKDVTVATRERLEDVARVWDAYRAVFPKKRVLDANGAKKIAEALALGYTTEDLCLVPLGASRSGYHMGDNESQTNYTGVSTLYREVKTIDMHIAKATAPAQVTRQPVGNTATTTATAGSDVKNTYGGKETAYNWAEIAREGRLAREQQTAEARAAREVTDGG